MLRAFLVFIAASTALSGCASYQLGQPRTAAYQAIYVAPARNQSALPQLEAPVNAAVRQALGRSEAFTLANEGDADAKLEIRLIEAKREMAAVLSEDVGRARKVQLVVEVAVDLKNASQPGSFYIRDRRFVITQDVFTDSGQVSAEYQAGPELADQIATRVTELLADTW